MPPLKMTSRLPLSGVARAAAVTALIVGAAWSLPGSRAAEPAVPLPPPTVDLAPSQDGLQTAVLAGGCFWGVQAVYQHTEGVVRAMSGYSGDSRQTAVYEIVSAGRTKHAEAVEVRFDPKKISYGRILQIFFSVAHNPTELDRQGPDIGPQYRSAIFYADDEQKRIAEAYIRQLDDAKRFKGPIVTRLEKLSMFYPAEAYHQDYAIKHPNQPYIAINDLPKIENLKRVIPDVYRATPVTVAAATAGRQ